MRWLKELNLPNKLTLLRVVLIPVFVVFLYLGQNSIAWRIAALAVFCGAAITDTLDGQIARKRNLITNFGKFMDPLADKLLVCSALICFIQFGIIPAWAVIIIIAREFIISGFRLVASDKGVVIAASNWGKVKTVIQMVTVILLIINLQYTFMKIINTVFIVLMTILTVVSLIDYLVKNKDVLKE